MDSLYNLAVRLELSAGGVTQAAEAAIATFGRMEAGAARLQQTMRGLRLTLDTQGLNAGATEAMQMFRNLEMQGGRLGNTFRGMNLSGTMQPLISDYRGAEQALAGLESNAARAEQRVSSLRESMNKMSVVYGKGAGDPLYDYTRGQMLGTQAEAIHARTNLIPGAQTAVADTGYALQTHLATQTAAVEAATMAQQQQMNSSMGMLAVGAGLTMAGMAGVHLMSAWVHAASEVKDAITAVGLATVGTRGQLVQMETDSYTIAGKTMFSAPQILHMEQLAATAGLNNRTDLMAAMPTLAAGAELSYRLKGTNADSSVPAMVSIAHMFQAYGGKTFDHLLDLAGRAQLVAGLTPEQFTQSLRYVMPAVNAYHISAEDAISTVALGSNVGIASGRGGGALGRMFSAIAPLASARGSMHNKWLDRIQQQGQGQFFDKQGDFEGMTNMLEVVMRAMEHMRPEQRMMALQGAFSTAGAQAFATLATPGAVQRYQSIEAYLGPQSAGGLASTEQMRSTLNQTFTGQMTTLQTNLHSLAAIFGKELLPALTEVTHALVGLTDNLITFASQHPMLVKIAGTMALIATGTALIVGPLLAVVGAAGLLSAGLGAFPALITPITLSFAGLDLAMSPILLTVLAITAAVAGVTLLFMNWGTVTKAVGSVFDFLGTSLHNFVVWLGIAQDTGKKHTPPSIVTPQEIANEARGYVNAYNTWSAHAFKGVGPTLPGDVRRAEDDKTAIFTTYFDKIGHQVFKMLPPVAPAAPTMNTGPVLPTVPRTTPTVVPPTMMVIPHYALPTPTPTRDPRLPGPPPGQGGMPLHPVVVPHRTSAAGPAGSGRPVVNMHPGAVPVTINLHVGEGADHASTGKKLARQVATVFHSEIDAAIRNAQGQSLDMNGHYA